MAHSVRMAFEGRSVGVGPLPDWLKRSADVRVLGFSDREGDTLLELEALRLGEAAAELYEQPTLWNELPSQDDTAVTVMARAIDDVRNGNADSKRYDLSLLKATHDLRNLFAHDLHAIRLPESPNDSELSSVIDSTVPAKAQELSSRTPAPRQVRLVGTLDMIRWSTRSIALQLKDGKEVRGVLDKPGMSESFAKFLNKKVVLVGKAIYRPSGTVLRIDVNHYEETTDESALDDALFSSMPPPLEQHQAKIGLSSARTNIAAFFGIWPGEETDEELLGALKEIRG